MSPGLRQRTQRRIRSLSGFFEGATCLRPSRCGSIANQGLNSEIGESAVTACKRESLEPQSAIEPRSGHTHGIGIKYDGCTPTFIQSHDLTAKGNIFSTVIVGHPDSRSNQGAILGIQHLLTGAGVSSALGFPRTDSIRSPGLGIPLDGIQILGSMQPVACRDDLTTTPGWGPRHHAALPSADFMVDQLEGVQASVQI